MGYDAATAPSNLDAAITMRSPDTELQNTIELRAAAWDFAAPKPDLGTKGFFLKKYLEALLARNLKRKITSAKIEKSADKSLSQPRCGHPNTIYNAQLQKTIVTIVLRMQPRHQATFMQPSQCILQHDVANPHVSTHMATPDGNNHAAISIRSAPTGSRNAWNSHTGKATRCRTRRRNRLTSKRSKPQPPHTGGTFRCRQQPLYTEKTQGFVLRLPPQHKPHATVMQPSECILQHDVANPHVSTHICAHIW